MLKRRKISPALLRRILIIRPDRIGDLVLTLPLAAVLKRINPSVRIHYLVAHRCLAVLESATEVDDCLLYDDPSGQPVPLGRLADQIADNDYELAIFAKPGWRTSMAVFLAGVPYRIGTVRRPYSALFNYRVNLPRKFSNTHEVDLNLQLLRPLGIVLPPGSVNPRLSLSGPICFNERKAKLPPGYIVVHPSSGGSGFNWPSEHYAALVAKLALSFPVIVTGLESLPVAQGTEAIDLTGETSLSDLMSIIAGARLFISGSTGPLHLACALDVPVIGIFPRHPYLGPQRWGPRSNKARVLTPPEQKGHRCSSNSGGTCSCMWQITVDSVVEQVLEMMP